MSSDTPDSDATICLLTQRSVLPDGSTRYCCEHGFTQVFVPEVLPSATPYHYVAEEPEETCVFCDWSRLPSETEIMYGHDGSSHYVFEPLDPVTPGHLLVVPRAHVRDATEDPLVTAMGAGVAAKVALRYPSANLITSIGVPATQSVFHLYWHVVPREDGDGLMLPWSHPPEKEHPNEPGAHQ